MLLPFLINLSFSAYQSSFLSVYLWTKIEVKFESLKPPRSSYDAWTRKTMSSKARTQDLCLEYALV